MEVFFNKKISNNKRDKIIFAACLNYCETPIPKAKRIGIGKLNPDGVGTKRRV
jgi:hypothetical protein